MKPRCAAAMGRQRRGGPPGTPSHAPLSPSGAAKPRSRGPLLRRALPHILLALPLLLAAGAALARAGGGQSYSGGSSSNGGGSSGGGGGGGDASGLIFLLIELAFRYPAVGVPLLVVAVIFFLKARSATATGQGYTTGAQGALQQAASAAAAARAGHGSWQLDALRQDDPDFSEPLFLDFVAALVARGVAAAGAGKLAPVERYLAVPQALAPFGQGGWRNVVVGATRIRTVGVGPEGARVAVEVALGATGTAGGRWWRSTWTLVRKAGVHSKGPGEITRLACPACGAGAERSEDGSCKYCGQRPAPGEAAWAVLQVLLLEAEERPPVTLGGYAAEQGTELPTVRSPSLEAELAAVQQRLPDLDWSRARARFTQVFLALQQGWSTRDLPAIRPLTTDAVFATWRYWIEAYQAAGLRNVLELVQVAGVEPAHASLDRYYAAVTVRILASMVDRTVDDGGRVVDGAAAPRRFTEYWTFVRTLGAAKQEGVTCPGCGATLPAGQTGQCPYCGSLAGAPAFDWILSRIDQDEDYTGG